MRSLVAAGTGILLMWCLLYANEVVAPSPLSSVLRQIKNRGQPRRSHLLALGFIFLAVTSVPLASALGTRYLATGPALSALFGAVYAVSLAAALSLFVASSGVRAYLLANRLPGWLSFSASALAAVTWLAGLLLPPGVAIGLVTSIASDMLFMALVLLAFLCLPNTSRVPVILGACSLVALALVLLSPVGLFFPVWLNAAAFWPFVILGTLATEGILLRLARRSLL